MHLAVVPIPLDIVDDHHGPRRVEAGQRDLRVSRLAIGARMHDRNHASGVIQVRTAGEAAHDVEEMQRVEIDLFVERFHRRDLFLIDRQPVFRLAHRQVDGELAEERRVLGPRLAFAERHHMVVERRQCFCLKMIPEALRIGVDPLVDNRLPVDIRADPAGRHANVLVIREAIEESALDDFGLEPLTQDLPTARRGRDDLVRRRRDRPLLERDLFQIDFQLLGEDLVDGINFEQPPRRHIHALLFPA